MPWRRRVARGDDGVIAVLTALLVAAVLLPVAALGLTAYVRAGVADEKRRAAEAGALNGAANLTLTNLRAVPLTSLVAGTFRLPSVPSAQTRACVEEGLAAAEDDVLSVGFSASRTCRATAGAPTALQPCLAGVTGLLGNVLAPVTQASQQLVNELGGLLGGATLTGNLSSGLSGLGLGPSLPGMTGELSNTLVKLVPALMQDRVTVDVRYQVAGPLDALVGDGSSTDPAQVSATARRVFKPLLPPLASVLVPPLDTATGLTPLLTGLHPAERLAVAMLQVVIAALDVAVGNVQSTAVLSSLLDVTGTQLDALARPLIGTLGGLLALVNGLVNALLGDLLGNLRLTVTLASLQGLGSLGNGCLTAVREVLGDLKNALQINDDPSAATAPSTANRGLLPCLITEVLGLPDLGAVGGAVNCTNPIFRARLVPGA